jgi:hypothetical protein
MAREWYLRDQDRVWGPFTGAELKVCSVHRKSWKLRDFVGVETDVEQRLAQTIGILVLFFWV